MTYSTLLYEVADDHVATITLNRPEVLNAFNRQMGDDFEAVWRRIRDDDHVHSVVLRAAGDRAFCTGVDVKEGWPLDSNLWNNDDPGEQLSPKLRNKVWKPLVCAVHGMAAGGAFYWLNEADIIICSDDATFFDPHVTYGMTAALEPIGLTHRIALGDVLRMTLLGLDERMTPERALAIGLVTEITSRDDLWVRAHELAAMIAAKPPAAIQGSVRAIWESLDLPRTQALARGSLYCEYGNPTGIAQVDPEAARPAAWSSR